MWATAGDDDHTTTVSDTSLQLQLVYGFIYKLNGFKSHYVMSAGETQHF